MSRTILATILGAPVRAVEGGKKYTCDTCLGVVTVRQLGPNEFCVGLVSWTWSLEPAGLRRIGYVTLTVEEAIEDADRVLSELVKRARVWDPTEGWRP